MLEQFIKSLGGKIPGDSEKEIKEIQERLKEMKRKQQ
jgi:hypothetical protein